MRASIYFLGIFAFALFVKGEPRVWHLQTGETVTGDYVSSGTTTLVVKTGDTNCLIKISSLSTNDRAFVSEIRAHAAKTNSQAADIRYFSATFRVWTNAAGVFERATNSFNRRESEDHHFGGLLMVELGNAGYLPAEKWLGQQYAADTDPLGKLGYVINAWQYKSSEGITRQIEVLVPGGGNKMYDYDPYHEESDRWYIKAAGHGDAEAQVKAGEHYSESGDYAEALKWYNMAAASGEKKALRAISWFYRQGHGVPMDANKAREYLLKGEFFYEVSSEFLKEDNRIGAYTWWCVGNARLYASQAPFSFDYAKMHFSAYEIVMGGNAAASYLVNRYGSTNAVAPPSRSSKQKTTR